MNTIRTERDGDGAHLSVVWKQNCKYGLTPLRTTLRAAPSSVAKSQVLLGSAILTFQANRGTRLPFLGECRFLALQLVPSSLALG